MTTTLERRPVRKSRSSFPYWNAPFDRFLRSDLLDLMDSDIIADTIPSVNIKEEKDQYKVELAAPGLKKEDFNVSVDGNLLTISSEKETETNNEDAEKNNNGYSRREYNYSSFSRSVTLPDFADVKGIMAKYNDGILSLTIPKKPEAQKESSQKIKVQ